MADEGRLAERIASVLREVGRLEDVLFVVENGPHATIEAWVDPTGTTVEVQGDWAAVESRPWHCHLDLSAVAAIRFVEEPDVHDLKRQAFSIRLLGKDDRPLLMIFFTKMYDDAGVLSQDNVSRFHALRQTYG